MSNFVNPEVVLEQLHLQEQMIAADFGCGSGGWVLPLAEILHEGVVYAIDIQANVLSALQGKARLLNLNNVKTLQADVEKPISHLGSQTCDLVLLTNLLFQVENKPAVFLEAKRVLKPKGKLLVVDWAKETSFGPKNILDKEEVISTAQKMNFSLKEDFAAGSYHFALIFINQ